jgi:hypothetical protein
MTVPEDRDTATKDNHKLMNRGLPPASDIEADSVQQTRPTQYLGYIGPAIKPDGTIDTQFVGGD